MAMSAWSDWAPESSPLRSRYAHWWWIAAPADRDPALWGWQIFAESAARFAQLRDEATTRFQAGPADPMQPEPTASPEADTAPIFPMPRYMLNPGFVAHLAEARQPKAALRWLPRKKHRIPEGTRAVLGVIDIGIGLGHRRFRNADGSSRVLASWQMGAPFAGQTYLPCGKVLRKPGIDALLAKHAQGDMLGPLDEDAFNTEAGLVVTGDPLGPRGLRHRRSHGTHILDVAGGAAPESNFARSVPLLVVNLPAPVAFGEGGGFLDYYLVYALRWLLETYAGLVRGVSDPPPLMSNISIGKFAGSRDRTQDFVTELVLSKEASRARRKKRKVDPDKSSSPEETRIETHGQVTDGRAVDPIVAKVELNATIPAGNDNLSRCNVVQVLEPAGQDGSETTVNWNLPPGDYSSNILEVWTKSTQPPGGTAPIAVDLAPPGQKLVDGPAGKHGQVRKLAAGLGRIWCDLFTLHGAGGEADRIYTSRHVVALAPSDFRPAHRSATHRGAAAGPWRLRIRNLSDLPIFVGVAVQSDQVALPFQPPPQRSHFSHPAYRMFDDQGRWMDSYSYGATTVETDGPGPVRRRGTLNTYAANKAVMCIGGFCYLNGRPAAYSATAFGRGDGLDPRIAREERRAPTAAFVSDDGIAHAGILGAGSRDGSTVAMSGTSVASALATRAILDRIVAGDPPIDWPGQPLAVRQLRQLADRDIADRYGGAKASIATVGRGRVIFDEDRHRHRLGR